MREAGIPLVNAGGLPPRRNEVGRPSPMSELDNLTPSLAKILRPQAAYRWLLPSLAAITPQYIESTLRGALAGNHVQAWELFDLMLDSDPEIAACTQEFTEGVQRKKLIFEAYHEEDEEPTPEAIQRMRVVSQALRNMHPEPAADENDLDATLKDILSARFMGQTVLEVDWHTPDGEIHTVPDGEGGMIIAPRATYWVHPVCYAWSMEGRLGLRKDLNVRATTQEVKRAGNVWNFPSYQPRPSNVDDFPEHKFLVCLHKAKSGTALAGAMLRPLAWWWCASNFCGDWLLNLAQLFGIPFRKAKYQSGTGENTKEEIRQMLQNAGSAGYILLPDSAEVEFIEAGGGAQQSPQAFLFEFADRQKRKIILGQTMTGSSGTTGKGGGQAFGEVEADVKSNKIDAGGKFACQVINSQLIPSILELNFGDCEEAPTIRLLDDEEGNLTDAQRDSALATAGLKIGVNFLRKKYGIPAPSADEETIGGMPMPAANPPAAQIEAANKSSDQSVYEALADDVALAIDRLQAIAQIKDDAVFTAKLRQYFADFPNLAEDIKKDSATSRALRPVVARAFTKGLKP